MRGVELSSGYVAFKPRARLLKLIGSELISDDVVAVTELVKNAHDADATVVTITFHGVTTLEGSITISDDGHGMDRDALLGGWMQPAGSAKRGPQRKVSPSGRWVLGEKGLGRFAADKLGARLELLSRRSGSAAEVRATFDWDQFDSDTAMLGDVKNRWEIRPAIALSNQGTRLRIGRLRSTWTERMFRRLCTRLSRLHSPFAQGNNFAIRIESDEFPQYSGELPAGFLEKAPYSMDARFNGTDRIQVALRGTSPSVVPWQGASLDCGPIRIRLYAFDLETEAMAKIGPRTEVRSWLKEWCGISVYRDGFRVWPYGEPHDDWLRLDHRRVNNPVVCLSNNQVVGFVEISQRDNPELRDQTSREGLIQNPALDDLRRLIHFTLQLLEGDRQSIRHPSGRSRGLKVRDEGIVTIKEKDEETVASLRELAAKTAALNGGGRLASEIKGMATRLQEELTRREQEHHQWLASYADLAAQGQAVSGLAREIRPMLEKLLPLLKHRDRKLPEEEVELLSGSLSWMTARMELIGSLSGAPGKRRRAIEVPVELQRSAALLRHILNERGVDIAIHSSARNLLRVDMSPEAFRLLFHILVTNSLDWLHGVRWPQLKISAREDGHCCQLLICDNGPGIPDGLEEKVFAPGFSLKEGGRGMGLTIARHIVGLHGGSICAPRDKRRRGATICILLPRKRSRAT
jgi:signal transduction histidine kinase